MTIGKLLGHIMCYVRPYRWLIILTLMFRMAFFTTTGNEAGVLRCVSCCLNLSLLKKHIKCLAVTGKVCTFAVPNDKMGLLSK